MLYEFCPNCFCPASTGVCSNCGYDQNHAKKYDAVLEPQYILNARYLIGRVLGKGGFGVTYLAKDLLENRLVAIKECMPETYSYRANDLCVYQKQDNTAAFNQCKQNFRDEISALVDLRSNQFVVNVSDFFSENNTEYFVMEYIDGVSLKVLTHSQGGKTSFENAVLILFTVGSALMEVHKQGIIHRDLSPENIMIARDGRIKLIDFGASKNYINQYSSDNESIFLKPGFAPPEQYDINGNQGPWTDVYALAATFYTVVSGKPLVDSTYRLEEDTMKTLTQLGCNVPQYVSDAVSKALSPAVEDRYKSVGDFLDDMILLAEQTVELDAGTLLLINHEKERQNKFGDNDGLYGNVKFPYVEIMTGSAAGHQIRIPDYGFISIGRSKEISDLFVDDFAEISRNHCLVGYDRSKNHFIVIDKSSNGTFYSNNQRMLYNADSFIDPNEEFYIYSSRLKVKVKLI